MTKHSDSPDVTRLSGEQAEERTAREGRAREWYRAQLPPPPECLYCGRPMSMTPTAAGIFLYCPKAPASGQGCTYSFTATTNLDDGIVECLAKYAESECSRLASRVEELEAALTKISKSKKYHEARLTGESMSVLNDAIWVAEQLLAGAHAEEKE